MAKFIATIDPGTATAGVCVWREARWYHAAELGHLAEGPIASASITLPKGKEMFRGGAGYTSRAKLLLSKVEKVLEPYLSDLRRVVIEEMQILPGRMDAAADVLGVAFFCGCIGKMAWDAGADIQPAPVMRWKGNMSKAMTAKRIAARFEEAGLDTESFLTMQCKAGHDWDAAGIGLWSMGLFGDRAAEEKR